ncbi:MAG: hypothetical protein ACOVO0_10230 [Burkholderiaceae bacterium]|jgi:hypothetical protein
MNLSLKRLLACPDAQALATELICTCTRYGSIRYLKILMARQGGQLQALCFWQMGDARAERQVMALLHVQRLANYLVLVVAMQPPRGDLRLKDSLPDQPQEGALWI